MGGDSMEPIKFEGCNIVFAENQPGYLPLPAFRDKNGRVTVCYRLKFWERIVILFMGNLWFQVLTFNKPIQPQKPSVKYPLKEGG